MAQQNSEVKSELNTKACTKFNRKIKRFSTWDTKCQAKKIIKDKNLISKTSELKLTCTLLYNLQLSCRISWWKILCWLKGSNIISPKSQQSGPHSPYLKYLHVGANSERDEPHLSLFCSTPLTVLFQLWAAQISGLTHNSLTPDLWI